VEARFPAALDMAVSDSTLRMNTFRAAHLKRLGVRYGASGLRPGPLKGGDGLGVSQPELSCGVGIADGTGLEAMRR